jgi:arylsulfatase A-like enzyme
MKKKQPNILFILSDDHASHAISAYGSRINTTPSIDRIAEGGMRLDNCFCTNSICAPSRASILTGTYNHVNGVTTLASHLDGRQTTFPKLLRREGYQNAMIGKWHLGHGGYSNPTGFDHWKVLPGQGSYIDPEFLTPDGVEKYTGYVTDIITDMSIDWLEKRDREKPFCLLCHHKAPHRWWIPDEKHKDMYADEDIPIPETFDDDYSNRARAASMAEMRIDRDLKPRDLKAPVPEGLSNEEEKYWKYQRFIKDYLRCIASMDDNIGRLLDYLDEEGVAEDTIVIYSSDQGFFLGDHGWFDKRFMYEESLRMPMLIRYPREIPAGETNDDIILNVDFAQTLLDYAGVKPGEEMQGESFRSNLTGNTREGWRNGMYYRYWMHLAQHNVYSHYGIRTKDYKLIFYYAEACGQEGALDDPRWQEWELFDLKKDPCEMNNVYNNPAYADVVADLKKELTELQNEVGDSPVAERFDY